MKDQKIFTSFIVLLSALVLSGCLHSNNKAIVKATSPFAAPVTLSAPTLSYVNYQISNSSEKKVDVKLNFSSNNPNKVALKDAIISYELFTQGKRFLIGTQFKVTLPANTETNISVPAVVTYRNILGIIGNAAKKVLKGKRSISVLAKIKLVVYTLGAPNKFEVMSEAIIDVPFRQEEEKGQEVEKDQEEEEKGQEDRDSDEDKNEEGDNDEDKKDKEDRDED